MTEEPNSLQTLKRYYGDRLIGPDAMSLKSEFSSGNDRSIIISLTAQVESALEYKLAKNFPYLARANQKTYEYGFRFEGPLGPFSHRIELAFYMGLIDEGLRNRLDDLRAIRNAVAHTRRKVTFDDMPLRKAVQRLFHPRGVFKLLSEDTQGYRATFAAECSFLHPTLLNGLDEATKRLRESYIASGQTPPI